jgi:hypothetical protein
MCKKNNKNIQNKEWKINVSSALRSSVGNCNRIQTGERKGTEAIFEEITKNF